nr:zinc finger CCCH type with G patch [Hymenolepis microstoma]
MSCSINSDSQGQLFQPSICKRHLFVSVVLMDADLDTLRKTLADIIELISLTPENQAKDLIELKANIVEVIALKESRSENLSKDSDGITSDIFSHLPDDDVPGSRCSIMGWTSRGYFVHRNAVVAEVLRIGKNERKMRLYMANPTKIGEIPCSSYLKHHECPRGSLCRFSHGTIAASEDLYDWHEPEAELYLKEKQLCLALPITAGLPLWRHGYIRHTDIDAGTCVVEWINVSANANHMESAVSLPFTHVHPILDSGSEHPDLSPCDSSGLLETYAEEDDLKLDFADEDNSQTVQQHEIHFSLSEVLRPGCDEVKSSNLPPPSDFGGSDGPLGAWESHTRGIGSRLMQKMGYTGQGGLGKQGTGRRLPVSTDSRLHQIVLDEICGGFWHRPTIDQLVKLKSGIRRKRPPPKSARKAEGPSASKSEAGYYDGSVFDFLNSRVLVISSIDHNVKSQTSVTAPRKKMSTKEMNVEIYKIQREIHAILEEISRTEDIISRNDQRDRKVANLARQKLSDLRQRLRRLHEQESKFTSQVERRKSDAKLRNF